jgi:hypothetical protein
MTELLKDKVLFAYSGIEQQCEICFDEHPIEEIRWDNNNKCYACPDCNTDE